MPFSTTYHFELRTSNFLKEAFSRNIGLFTRLNRKPSFAPKSPSPGMGGVGGTHLLTLTRTGIGAFHIADFDIFEPANINRQAGASVNTFGRKKLDVMKEQALAINPYLNIAEFPEGIHEQNIDAFLDGVQVVVDGLDFFSFDTRRLLFTRAQEKAPTWSPPAPWATAPPSSSFPLTKA